MKKEETIRIYGEKAYGMVLEQSNEWNRANPEKVEEHNHQTNRKGGRYYEKKLKDQTTGIPGEQHRIRIKHANKWCSYKHIIAPDSQIHHEWILGTSRYSGIALVERDAHQHGIIDVIQILDGKITILTEAELKQK